MICSITEVLIAFLFQTYRQPAVDGNPINNFKPIEPNVTHFLNITNDGLYMGKNPNNRRTEFYDHFITEVRQLVESHGHTPNRNMIERIRDSLKEQNNRNCDANSIEECN